MPFDGLEHFRKISITADLIEKVADLRIDKFIVDFVLKDSLGSHLEEGLDLEGGFSFGLVLCKLPFSFSF